MNNVYTQQTIKNKKEAQSKKQIHHEYVPYSNETAQIKQYSIPEFIEGFQQDAIKAQQSLREAIKNNDLKLLITTANAMKTALAIIGENEISKMAYGLETAGLNNDWKFINANYWQFTVMLEVMIQILEWKPEVA